MNPWGEALVALAVGVGVVGVVVPVLPGLLLVWAAVVTWAVVEAGTAGWTLVAGATVVAVVAQVLKYVVPGRQLRRAGVSDRALLVGGLAGIVGFFVVPLVGLVVGFVAGVYAVERHRLRNHRDARAATFQALRAAGVSILLELGAALLIAAAWASALVAT